jgi:hypothetical protein
MKKVAFNVIITTFYAIQINVYTQNQDFDEYFRINENFLSGSSQYISAYWTSLPNSPHAVSRSCCAYIEINGIPYIYQFGGGNNSDELRRVARLNLHTNQWQNNYTTLPHPLSSGTAIPMGNGIIYVFGGNLSPGSLGKSMRYDAVTNTWQTLADMPTRVTDALVVKYDDSRIIIVGGGDGYFGTTSFKTNKVQLYNVNSNTYTYLNDLPIALAMHGGAIYRDTIITAGGYISSGSATANCYKGVINPANMSITWTSIPSYPAGPIVRMASYIAVKDNGTGVMFTGGAIGGTNPTASTHFWSFCLQQWLPGLPDNSLARSNFKACGKGDHRIYMTGGYTNSGVGTTEYITFTNIDGPCNGMVGNEGNSNLLREFSLEQNYPNPFNSETLIDFHIPVPSHVVITVSDISGKEIAKLFNGFCSAGSYSVRFNPLNLSSGVYLYTIQTGSFRQTKSMLYLK